MSTDPISQQDSQGQTPHVFISAQAREEESVQCAGVFTRVEEWAMDKGKDEWSLVIGHWIKVKGSGHCTKVRGDGPSMKVTESGHFIKVRVHTRAKVKGDGH